MKNKEAYNEASKANPIPKGDSKHAKTLVKIKDFNPSKHLLKVVRASDGEPIEDNIFVEGDITQTKPYDKRAAKVLKTSETSDGPILEITDDSASLRGSPDFGFYSYNKFGNVIKGPTSLTAAPHEIRLSGVTTLNPLLTTCFPSTIVTPIPTTVWSLPGAGLLGPIGKDVAIMGALVAIMGI
ncbi:MAG: hypothetical protein PHY47_00335 [Lachnospiraceae bacterium]|nr:hypothetical protein [Lachnospiraceae bacterium]